MKYGQVVKASFLKRPNRFIAHVLIDGVETVCHVKNTGRCRELLLPGATVYLEKAANLERKTAYDLIAVEKDGRLINMDAAAPNAVCLEWLKAGGLGFVPDRIIPEKTHGDSRFDFYLEFGNRKGFLEVKGVTLEDCGVARFPDAPTARGQKHLCGLISCLSEGFEAWAVFVIQMRGIRRFEPNDRTDPGFSQALREAKAAGVHVLALECQVAPDELQIAQSVELGL